MTEQKKDTATVTIRIIDIAEVANCEECTSNFLCTTRGETSDYGCIAFSTEHF